jgi:hypothetical protein
MRNGLYGLKNYYSALELIQLTFAISMAKFIKYSK